MADTLPPLPSPDTHCEDTDTQQDCWSYSADQMRAYAAAAVAAEREAWINGLMPIITQRGGSEHTRERLQAVVRVRKDAP